MDAVVREEPVAEVAELVSVAKRPAVPVPAPDGDVVDSQHGQPSQGGEEKDDSEAAVGTTSPVIDSASHDRGDLDGESSGDDPPIKGLVEVSPNQRYLRFEERLSGDDEHSMQSSYKAFDTKNGIEVAWHIINLTSLKEKDERRATHCINAIQDLQYRNVISFLACWSAAASRTLNIITTNHSTLKEFISKVVTLRWRIVKKWCKQILHGLDALHGSTPEIIHRNLTCSHIYIDAGLGTTNIGDMWLAAILDENQSLSGLPLSGTSPAFMAPEVLERKKVSAKVI
jgi:Protein kinase domain